jgi:hypothetical protein
MGAENPPPPHQHPNISPQYFTSTTSPIPAYWRKRIVSFSPPVAPTDNHSPLRTPHNSHKTHSTPTPRHSIHTKLQPEISALSLPTHNHRRELARLMQSLPIRWRAHCGVVTLLVFFFFFFLGVGSGLSWVM